MQSPIQDVVIYQAGGVSITASGLVKVAATNAVINGKTDKSPIWGVSLLSVLHRAKQVAIAQLKDSMVVTGNNPMLTIHMIEKAIPSITEGFDGAITFNEFVREEHEITLKGVKCLASFDCSWYTPNKEPDTKLIVKTQMVWKLQSSACISSEYVNNLNTHILMMDGRTVRDTLIRKGLSRLTDLKSLI